MLIPYIQLINQSNQLIGSGGWMSSFITWKLKSNRRMFKSWNKTKVMNKKRRKDIVTSGARISSLKLGHPFVNNSSSAVDGACKWDEKPSSKEV